MKAIIAGAVSVGLMLTLTTAANAGHTRHYRNYDNYSETYLSATPRQLQNLRGYERSEYYEHDSNAFVRQPGVVGTQAGRGALMARYSPLPPFCQRPMT